jgi:hypothetical protein
VYVLQANKPHTWSPKLKPFYRIFSCLFSLRFTYIAEAFLFISGKLPPLFSPLPSGFIPQ